jgi:hypothetical protein
VLIIIKAVEGLASPHRIPPTTSTRLRISHPIMVAGVDGTVISILIKGK